MASTNSNGEKPTLRWGIISTGMISSWFVTDLLIPRHDAKATHIIQSIGSSSLEKGKAFAAQYLPSVTPAPTIYGSYEEVYADPNVDAVYIGTPHAFHKKNCLDAIAAGKNVLCEKAFTLNATEAREVFAAAKKKGVFVMEAMWTRFFPLVQTLQKVVHDEKAIGKVQRVFCDFSQDQKLGEKGPDSRLMNLSLGASSLLDIGIYSLTWGLLGLETSLLGGTRGEVAEKPGVVASASLLEGVDVATSVILQYADGRQGIVTTHAGMGIRTGASFCRIEGSEGIVLVDGPAAPVPESFTVVKPGAEDRKIAVERVGKGFYWEADAVAGDIAAGRTESEVMSWAETVRVLELMDEARKQGGIVFPQDAK